MSQVIKLAFFGDQGAGKSTVVSLLGALFESDDVKFEKISFAEPLYRLIRLASGVDKHREGLQRLANLLRDIYGEDVLVTMYKRRYNELVGSASGLVMILNDDARVQEEYDYLKQEGYTLIRVDAPVELRRERCVRNGTWNPNSRQEGVLSNHSADFIITNDSDDQTLLTQRLAPVVAFLKGRMS